MSTFTINSITTKGLNIIAQLVAGSTLEFTRIAIGDGAMPSDKTPLTVTDLSNKLFDVDISNVTHNGNGSATVTGIFSNADKETGFFYRELGLFAKDPKTQAEVLYCYGNAGADAEWISPSGASSVIEKEVKIVTLVGNAETVTASIKSGIYATKEELENAVQQKADLDAPAEEGGRVLASQMRFDAEQTLYVDAAATAEDPDGSELKPFKTIQAAINARYKGAAVIYIKIKAGTYAEDISVPRSPGTTWRLTREGTGTVSIKSAVIDNCTYLHMKNLTFSGPTKTEQPVVHVANVSSVNIDTVTINGTSNDTGIHFGTSRGIMLNSNVNNCGLAIAATDGSTIDLKNNGGTGNTRALHADGSVIICDYYVPAATTKYERTNGGVINVLGGDTSFPSNYSQLYSLGDFTDAAALKTALLAEFGKLGIGEKRECWFANNISAGFGPFSNGQRMQATIIKSTNSGSGYGTVLFYSHHNNPAGYMQIQDGAFATSIPNKFATWSQVIDQSTNLENLPTGIHTLKANFASQLPIEANGTIICDADASVPWQLFVMDYGAKMYKRHKTGEGWTNWDDFTPYATASTYGLVKVADQTAILNESDEAALTVDKSYELNDFRRMNTTYAVGDKVNCAFKFELFLECTQAGTTSAYPLNTRNATHGQIITDGTVQWTVRTHIKSVNGVVAGADGNVNIDTGVLTVNGQEPDESGNVAIDVDVKAKISITTGTIAHGGTIPIPDGYTRDQCCYAVWSHQMPDADKSYGGNSYHRTQVDQSTGVVFCQYNYDGNKLNGTAGYMCIAIKD